MKREKLTAQRLRSLLHYDPETGIFTWIYGRRGVTQGSEAGTINNGYVQICIGRGFAYRAHRLAWLWMTGEWPTKNIDHRDTVKNNNRWINLREATKIENGINRGKNKNNTSGFKGVTWDKRKGKWLAQIVINGKHNFLGHFSDPSIASDAYAQKCKEAFGEFARAA